MTERPMYRPDEVAKELKVSISTIYAWIRSETIEHIHIGRLIRIPAEEVARLMKCGIVKKCS